MNYEDKYQFALKALANYQNSFEIGNFRKFLLLILNLESSGPEAMLRQLGMAPKGKTTLPYDPVKKAYYTKIMSNLSMKSQLFIYHKTDKLSETFINKAESPLITDNLTTYESKNLLPSKFVIITPDVVDFSSHVLKDQNSPKPCCVGIESLYENLAELIITQNSKFLFLYEGEAADLIFTMNISMEPTSNSKNSIQFFDVYVDEKKEVRTHTFIKMKKEAVKKGNLSIEFLDDIKDLSHSEMFDSQFTIIVPIKSFDLF